MPKVAYVGGFWAPNIGNAFYNLGADVVLKRVFGEDNVTMIFDQPANIMQWDTKSGNPPWALDFIGNVNVDYMVLLGPVLSRSFLPIWRKNLDTLKKRGIRYMILSAGMMKYDAEVLKEIKEYFKENPPYVITTRDEDTYNEFKDCVERIYNGVCFAFFVPDYYKPIETTFKPYITLNFDKIDEPIITINDKSAKSDISFEFNEDLFKLRFKGLFSRIGLKTDRFTDALIYMKSPLPRGKRPDKIGRYNVIRTDHRYAPMFMRKVYRYNNSFCSDIPHTYLNLYAETELTISDRVHACAATLAFGNSAYLLAKTGRSALLDRVGAKAITKHPVKIDLKRLNKEKEAMVNWLKEIVY